MIRRKLLKATLLTTVIACILTSTACGKKTSGSNTVDNITTKHQVAVNAEAKSNAAKELTKTSLVTFDYTDEAGNTYTLEGKAVANESGAATIEVSDNNGNKVTFTGKVATADGKMTVSGITVKDAGTLIKPDGTEIKVTTGTIVADAAKSDETTESDITASEDAKQEVETSKKEEAVTKAEETADNTTDNNGGNSDDTIIADNGSNESSDNQGNDESSDNNDNAGNTDSNPGSSDNNNSDNNVTPASPTPDETEDKKDETPAPAPVEPTPDNSKDNSDNGNNGGYDFPTVEGPNGPMYAFTGNNYDVAGQDVNQGANVDCPYPLKTVTTRYFFDNDNYSYKQGYYYAAIDSRGHECEDPFDELHYQMGKYNCRTKMVGMYSCGMVWFTAFDD